jgi:3-oxoacyl-(acyl-carrier-protein) synthase III
MTTKTFYERRNGSQVIDFNDRRTAQRRNGQKAALTEQRRLVSQIRRYEREAFKIPVRLKLESDELPGYTHDISPEGILVFTGTALRSGMPMNLRFSFGKDLCSLNVSGQVVFCRLVEKDGAVSNAIGIKFSGIREFEKKILTSAVQELRQSPDVFQKSLLSILVSPDTLVREIAGFSIKIPRSLEVKPAFTRLSSVHASDITGWGAYLPEKKVTTDDINAMFDAKGYKKVGDVVKHLTGIKSRQYVASLDQLPSDMAVKAGSSAIKNAGIDPKDLDIIIFCGVSRDVEEPATANIVREKMGAKNAYVFDLANACNGFISAIDVVDSFIASNRCEIGLVVAGENMSQYVTWEPLSKKDLKLSAMSYTFGDGGGAAVVCRARNAERPGIRANWFLADTSYWNVAVIPLINVINGNKRLFKSIGSEIEKAALKHVPIGVEETMQALNWEIDDIDLVIPHQVSSHIITNLFYKRLGMPSEKIFWSFPRHGNVGAASMPVAVCEAFKEGRLKDGDKVLFVGGSGGFGVGIMGLVI